MDDLRYIESVLRREGIIYEVKAGNQVAKRYETKTCFVMNEDHILHSIGFFELPVKFDTLLLELHGFKAIQSLGILRCSQEQIKSILLQLSNPQQVKILDFSLCNPFDLSIEIESFSSLEELTLSLSYLSNIPEWISKLRGLKRLDISVNYEINVIPNWIAILSELEELSVNYSGIKELPNNLLKLRSLRSLTIDGCRSLKTLPKWLPSLNNLHILEMAFCEFDTLSPSLVPFLQRLDVSLQGVKIADVPPEIVEQGWNAIAQYYASLEQEKQLPERDDESIFNVLPELKIMIMGSGNSGKSSITRVMKKEKFRPNEPSTVGIALKDIPYRMKTDGLEWLLRIWDFGGQEAYAATQTVFMTDNTLYLLVMDGRTEEKPDAYLHYIQTFAPKSPILLVINKNDENERADLNRAVYLKEYANLWPEILRFSCIEEKDHYLMSLYTEIERILFSERYKNILQSQWSKLWLGIRADLITRLERDNFISGEEFRAICSERVDEIVRQIIRNACDILGVAFSYQNEETVPPIDRIMRPKWVTDGMNYLFQLDTADGFVNNSEISAHMRKTYSDEDIRCILSVLEKKSLILLTGRQCMIPALLPPSMPKAFPKDFDSWEHEFLYRYPYLHPVIKQAFMVKLYRVGTTVKSIYRYGVCWTNNSGTLQAVMHEDDNALAFYLNGEKDEIYKEREKIMELMSMIHLDEKIQTWQIHHVFQRSGEDDTGKPIILKTEYPHHDFFTLRKMGVKNLPLPGIRGFVSVDDIVGSFGESKAETNSPQSQESIVYLKAGHDINLGDIISGSRDVTNIKGKRHTVTLAQATETLPRKKGLWGLFSKKVTGGY